jgi:hypothetical protein
VRAQFKRSVFSDRRITSCTSDGQTVMSVQVENQSLRGLIERAAGSMNDRVARLSRRTAARYLVALGAVVTAFALRVLLTPLTGTGAPFVLCFAAVLVTSLYVGTGPGLAARDQSAD